MFGIELINQRRRVVNDAILKYKALQMFILKFMNNHKGSKIKVFLAK